MGVPRFFSWITKRYPLCMQDLEDYPLPDIDCLYLDMNGIIYKCSKDDSIIFRDQVMSRKAQEIWLSIFNYINSIVDMIKPKKLLFLGLDGVAPRAKMNNQRSRRFRSAKDYKQLERKLEYFGDAKNEEEFKNNCITPGTEFMTELNKQLRFFIAKKIQEDVKWREFNVIFSGADVPGEGEHKIMDFIRRSTELKVYDQDTSHCLYGADADLIMLGMTLKIKKLCIIREEFMMKSKKTVISHTRCLKEINFQIIYINILKEYFDLEYKTLASTMKIPYDVQRVLNDFVFLCFFIGNDFLPRCYCFDIRQGNLETLIYGFKKFLTLCENYLIHDSQINLVELERLTHVLSSFEGHFISSRSKESKRAYRGLKSDDPNDDADDLEEFEQQFRANLMVSTERMKTQEEFLSQMKSLYANQPEKAKLMFYQTKLKFDPATDPAKLWTLLSDYVQGLHYVYQYYFGGLPSWEWYYPYYYAPLVADLASYISYMNTARISLKPFEKSAPYEPFKQLMCILPRESAMLLPQCLQPLIQDDKSPLRSPIDYFPDKIEIDPYGGLQQHEFINILPFIDQTKITEVYKSIPQSSYHKSELNRNVSTLNELYIYSQGSKVLIKSFYSQITDFQAPMTIHLLNFSTSDILKLKTSQIKQPAAKLTFPTLYSKNFTYKFAQTHKKQWKIDLILPNSDQEKKDMKLGGEVYYGYPHECHGRVIAISEPDKLKPIEQFDVLEFIDNPDLCDKDFKKDSDYWKQAVGQAKVKGLQIKPEKIYFIKQSKVTVRKYNGEFTRSYDFTYKRIQPALVVSPQPKYDFTHTLFKPKNIREQFLKGQTVVILATKWAGSKGIVTGHEKDKHVRVKITDPIPQIASSVLDSINTNEYFFSIRFAAKLLDMDVRVLLDMLDSVQVFLDTDQPLALSLSKTLDLGLNLIKRSQRKIVPNMVRIRDQGADIDNLFKVFFELEISVDAVKLLHEYKAEHPEVFDFMDWRMGQLEKRAKQTGNHINFKKDIHAKDMFPSEKDPNKPVTKAYLWLLKQQEIYYHNASINSKKVSKAKITKLLQYFKTMKPAASPPKQIYLDPNYLYTQRLVEKGNIYLSRNPIAHAIQDRVVCFNEAHFGQRGVIIGISDYDYEVLFERPSFGKNDLGGLVDFLWGGKFDFRELYNINQFPGLIEPRFGSEIDAKTNLKKHWDGGRPDFVSKYKGKAITTMKEFHQISRYVNLPFEVGEKIAKAAKKKDAIDEADEGYTIVTGKRNYKEFFPSDTEKKVLEQTQGSMDMMKIVKEFAEKKSFLVEETVQEKPSQKKDDKKLEDFIEAKDQAEEQIKETKVTNQLKKAPQSPLIIQKKLSERKQQPPFLSKEASKKSDKPKYVEKRDQPKQVDKIEKPIKVLAKQKNTEKKTQTISEVPLVKDQSKKSDRPKYTQKREEPKKQQNNVQNKNGKKEGWAVKPNQEKKPAQREKPKQKYVLKAQNPQPQQKAELYQPVQKTTQQTNIVEEYQPVQPQSNDKQIQHEYIESPTQLNGTQTQQIINPSETKIQPVHQPTEINKVEQSKQEDPKNKQGGAESINATNEQNDQTVPKKQESDDEDIFG